MAMRAMDVLLASLVSSLLLVTVFCCSPPPRGHEEPTLTERVYHTNTVFHGRIVEKWRDDRLSMAGDDAFIAKTEVFCILKGPELPQFINVTMLGVVHARCTRIDVDEGEEYIIYGYSMDGVVLHNDMASVPASEDNINEAIAACDLEVKYPQGVDQHSAQIYCPRTAGPDECIPDEHSMAPGIQEPQTGNGDHEHHEDDGHDHDGIGHHDDRDNDGDHDHDDHDHDHPEHAHGGHDHDGDGDHDHDDHHLDHDHQHDHGNMTTIGGGAATATGAAWMTALLYLGVILLARA